MELTIVNSRPFELTLELTPCPVHESAKFRNKMAEMVGGWEVWHRLLQAIVPFVEEFLRWGARQQYQLECQLKPS